MTVQSDCQASRLGLCDKSALRLGGSSGFGSCHSRGSASYQRLTHSLGNFLCVVIKWRLSDCKWLSLRGASWVSGEKGGVQWTGCLPLPSAGLNTHWVSYLYSSSCTFNSSGFIVKILFFFQSPPELQLLIVVIIYWSVDNFFFKLINQSFGP